MKFRSTPWIVALSLGISVSAAAADDAPPPVACTGSPAAQIVLPTANPDVDDPLPIPSRWPIGRPLAYQLLAGGLESLRQVQGARITVTSPDGRVVATSTSGLVPVSAGTTTFDASWYEQSLVYLGVAPCLRTIRQQVSGYIAPQPRIVLTAYRSGSIDIGVSSDGDEYADHYRDSCQARTPADAISVTFSSGGVSSTARRVDPCDDWTGGGTRPGFSLHPSDQTLSLLATYRRSGTHHLRYVARVGPTTQRHTVTIMTRVVHNSGERINQGHDEFVNYCIDHGRVIRSSAGRLYCTRPGNVLRSYILNMSGVREHADPF